MAHFHGASLRYEYGPIQGWRSLRTGLRTWVGKSSLPGLIDYERLSWLRCNGFQAPRPRAAGTYLRGGLPQFHFLYKDVIEGAATLRQHLARSATGARIETLRAFARELAELHAKGFVHGDLQPRHVLILGAAETLAFSFDNPVRGLGRGRPTDDLASLMLGGASLFDDGEQRIMLGTYFAQAERLGRRVDRKSELNRIGRRRAALAPMERKRRIEAGRPVIDSDWVPPFLQLGAA